MWQWGDGGKVIEFKNGPTLCYRQELEALLAAQALYGLPDFSVVLLLMAACKDNFPEALVRESFPVAVTQSEPAQSVAALLALIHQLPKVYRTAPGSYHLLWMLISQDLMCMDAEHAQALVATFKRGDLDPFLNQLPMALYGVELTELGRLQVVAERFPTLALLESALATGMTTPPAAAPVTIPTQQLPDEEAQGLLDELLQDPRTAGLSQLARHLVAALNIPMKARGSNDLPLGGVSDITNRGNYDRLLLSELAADDITLMARLANNEALFLRREEPPVKVEKERIVLVDTTIKLWGMPRTFAAAAAIACSERNLPGNGLRAYALGGNRYAEADLLSKKGILKLLERLDPSLNATDGLAACLKELPAHDKEVILVTAQELLDDPAFAMPLVALQAELDFIIALTREGQLRLIEVVNGRRRLLSEATLDLKEILFKIPNYKPKPVPIEDTGGPAFMAQFPAPLYFPAISIRLRPNTSKIFSSEVVLVVTENRRALLWRSRGRGALELFPHIINSDCMDINVFPYGLYVIRVIHLDRSKNTIYVYDVHTHERRMVELEELVAWSPMFFNEGVIYSWHQPKEGGKHEFRSYDSATGESQVRQFGNIDQSAWLIGKKDAATLRIGDVKELVNPGYSCLKQVKYICVYTDLSLCIDGRSLIIAEDGSIRLTTVKGETAAMNTWVRTQDANTMYENPHLRLRRAQWKDGSMVYVDPRGLLHLKSSDTSLHEVTILLTIGAPTTLWASDGTCTGDAHFINQDHLQSISPQIFFSKYLKPILQHILSKA